MPPLLNIVHEDADLLVLNKPAGLVCHPTKGDETSSLIGRVRQHVRSAIHFINRLDRETSGLVVVAKNPVAARELGRLWETRNVRKEYLAVVHGHFADDAGVIDAPLGGDEQSRVAIKDCVRPDGAPAETEYTVEQRFTRAAGRFTLLHVLPRSGRKHQIRIHLQHIGHPVVGDKIYGGDEDIYLALVEGRLTEDQRRQLLLPYQALHAASIQFQWRGQLRCYACGPELWFQRFYGSASERSV